MYIGTPVPHYLLKNKLYGLPLHIFTQWAEILEKKCNFKGRRTSFLFFEIVTNSVDQKEKNFDFNLWGNRMQHMYIIICNVFFSIFWAHYEFCLLSPKGCVLFSICHLFLGSFSHHNFPMPPFEQLPHTELIEQILPEFDFPLKKEEKNMIFFWNISHQLI